MRSLSHRGKVWILIATFAAAVVALAFVPPIPQDPDYHNFADKRAFLGIPNFGDVTSNVGFAVVSLWGLWWLWRRGRTIFLQTLDARPYVTFFVGVTLVSIGSAYYHWHPNNQTLFWDRLPMTVAFMALFSAFVADRVDRVFTIRWLLPILLALGAVSLVYWIVTESLGQGDLRPYGLVQFYPMLAVPVMVWLFRPARYTDGRYVALIIAWYALSKLLERYDAAVFDALGGTVSGHSLKHLAAAAGVFMVLRMLATAAERIRSDAVRGSADIAE